MPPSGDVVNDAAIPFLLPSRLSGRSISLSRNAAGARAAGRNLFGKRQHVQTAQHFFLHEFADGNGNDAHLEEVARNGFYMQLVNQVGTVHADKIFPIQMLGYPRQRSGYQDTRKPGGIRYSFSRIPWDSWIGKSLRFSLPAGKGLHPSFP